MPLLWHRQIWRVQTIEKLDYFAFRKDTVLSKEILRKGYLYMIDDKEKEKTDGFPEVSYPMKPQKSDEPTEVVEKRNRVFSGRVFAAEVLSVRQSDGRESAREIVKHNGGAAVLPIDDEMNVYVVRQFRSPFMHVLTEIPAGKLEIGEDPKEAAIRELSEETGLIAENVVSLGDIFPTPGYCSEILYLYMATGLKQGECHPDEGEDLRVQKIPFSELLEMVDKNEIHDAKTVVAILQAARRMNL